MSSSWRGGRGSAAVAAAADDAMRLELDVQLKARELQVLEEVVAGARGLGPLVTELGVLSKLVLAGAGGLVFVWGLSKFCAAVALPFLPPSKRLQERRVKGASTPPASP
jgi:hypothetical protein